MPKGHWIYNSHIDVNEYYGFIYEITNMTNGRKYIGRKTFWNTNRKKVKGRKNRKKVTKESNWKTYSGSSKELNKDIELLGHSNFRFEILELHTTKGMLSIREPEIQWERKVLYAKLPCGGYKYYNKVINAARQSSYSHSDETCKKMSLKKKGNTNAKGRVVTDKEKEASRIRSSLSITTPDGVFNSITAAAEHYGVSYYKFKQMEKQWK